MNILKFLRPVTWIGNCDHGYACGYVGVPIGHPWFNKDYTDIEVNIHGGLTYSEDHLPGFDPDDYWWVGFDTNHYSDTLQTCNKTYCQNQLAYLYDQAIALV